jgi:hypothetical protein
MLAGAVAGDTAALADGACDQRPRNMVEATIAPMAL